MTDQEKEQKNAEMKPEKEQAEYTPSVQPDFLREKIKQKPVNKKKLLRRTLITVAMAVVFGLVACFTFLILEPVISNRLYPEEEAQEVQFPEETVTEEMKPEDMLVQDEVEEEPVQAELEDEQIEELLSQVQFSLEDYQVIYAELAQLATEAGRSVVTVTGVTSDVDWFNNTYENMASASGVIVANNGKSILVLVSAETLHSADSIIVTFCDQAQAEAEVVQRDQTTGLAILSVPLLSISEETMDVIDIATLGSSNNNNLLGTPVIALGSPMGTSGSVCYGVVTSTGTTIDQPDAAYKMIMTDIYGSHNATGVFVNLKGMVIGIIDNANTSNDMGNLLTAYGISELKKTIEKMSNDQELAYIGVHGADVPQEAIEELDIPAGAYIKEIEMDSPAMAAGIQSGDVVTRVNEEPITTYGELLNMLNNAEPEQVMTITLMRQGREMSVEVTLGTR
ncbi:MAG: PDZ domain-containing protein [Lachnospiraceae bacterium]|nr:PDZ domain-containing protein [Lachnospiraceae bacterium]